MTTAPAAIVAAPAFTVHGELSARAISALARILIAHARREIEAEGQQIADQAADHTASQDQDQDAP